jgi:hypothetical protein
MCRAGGGTGEDRGQADRRRDGHPGEPLQAREPAIAGDVGALR